MSSTWSRANVCSWRTDDIDLSVLAPPLQPDEALSSWLVRIADAHLITVPELEEILGAPVTGLIAGI